MIENRIEKNYKKLSVWAEKNKIEAFRLYDRDIPEFPFLVDKYKDYFVVYDKSQSIDAEKNHLPLLISALKNVFQTDESKIILKLRSKQKGSEQYQKLNDQKTFIAVLENNTPLLVNLWDYLDTGLFIDHRPMRYHFLKNMKNKRFLNLFCYTGAASVMAAKSGATTYSVDMSATYLNWAKENFKLNGFDLTNHFFYEENVIEFLKHCVDWPDFQTNFDCIFLDPPTFSNSKNMQGTFDVERDQLPLISSVMRLLKSNGVLYFSNNKRDFKLNIEIENKFYAKNITPQTIPIDVHDQKIHKCYEIRLKS